jgi:hypothetical protein
MVQILLDNGACSDPPIGHKKYGDPQDDAVAFWPLRWLAEADGHDAALSFTLSHINIVENIAAGGEDRSILLLVVAARGMEDLGLQIPVSGCNADTATGSQFPTYGTSCQTPLAWAIQGGHLRVTVPLLKHGANPDGDENSMNRSGI